MSKKSEKSKVVEQAKSLTQANCYVRYTTRDLLDLYVWGKEPESLDKIKLELEKRKINTSELGIKIDNVIKSYL